MEFVFLFTCFMFPWAVDAQGKNETRILDGIIFRQTDPLFYFPRFEFYAGRHVH